jgi:hypothetical protein
MSTPEVEPLTTPNPATTNWVPIWNLNPTGVDLRYLGDYVAGSYSDGDVVVYQGVIYECVRPTTNPPVPWTTGAVTIPPVVNGQVLKGVAGAAVWSPNASYGTTLPASPSDGQEAVLVDSITAPTYQWRFRYNAGNTSAYKWEFVGGAPSVAYAYAGAYQQFNGSSVWIAGGPTVAVPRAGVYDALLEGQFQCSAAGATLQSAAMSESGTPSDQPRATILVNASQPVVLVSRNRVTAATTIQGGSWCNIQTPYVANAALFVWPVRV